MQDKNKVPNINKAFLFVAKLERRVDNLAFVVRLLTKLKSKLLGEDWHLRELFSCVNTFRKLSNKQ